MDRQTRIADLAIHGWRPIQTEWGYGIANDTFRVAFGVQTKPWKADPLNQQAGCVRHANGDRTDCEWDKLTNEILDAIEARLSET